MTNNFAIFRLKKYWLILTIIFPIFVAGVPSEPYNVTVKQLDSTHVSVSWNQPLTPNGVIVSYQVGMRSADPNFSRNIQLHNRNETTHTFDGEFVHNMTYSFFVSKILHNSDWDILIKILSF